jgi:hypothetical protein
LASGGCRNGKGLTRKNSASAFWKAKLFFIPEKKKGKGQSTPPKLLK